MLGSAYRGMARGCSAELAAAGVSVGRTVWARPCSLPWRSWIMAFCRSRKRLCACQDKMSSLQGRMQPCWSRNTNSLLISVSEDMTCL